METRQNGLKASYTDRHTHKHGQIDTDRHRQTDTHTRTNAQVDTQTGTQRDK